MENSKPASRSLKNADLIYKIALGILTAAFIWVGAEILASKDKQARLEERFASYESWRRMELSSTKSFRDEIRSTQNSIRVEISELRVLVARFEDRATRQAEELKKVIEKSKP